MSPTKFLHAALLLCGGALSVTAPLMAQEVPPPPPPPGYVLVDDMYLPVEVVYGDATYSGPVWTGGIVPYVFNANVTATNQTRTLNAMAELSGAANITFVPRTTEANYIVFNASTVNNSWVGMIGGGQTINMVSWNERFVICHEIIHALGYQHEQSRPDRNTFVTINYANINQTGCNGGGSCNYNFDIVAGSSTVGTYDFGSIMHYGLFDFSGNGQPTISVNASYASSASLVGNRVRLSTLDALGLQNRYGLPPAPTVTSISSNNATTGATAITLTVTGTVFYGGSPDAIGVQGSVVKFGGTALATTFVSPTTLTATIPTTLLDQAGCFPVTVENAYPGGGVSNAIDFTVGPTGNSGYYLGSQENAYLGTGLCAMGDVTGDGIIDYAVGEPGWDNGVITDNGRVHLINGSTGAIVWTATNGGSNYDYGSALANIGDVNADGINDLVVGAPGYNADQGLCRILNGSTGVSIRSYFGTAGTTGRFGSVIAAGGDLNADGVRDFVVGAPAGAGYALVLSGAAATTIRTHNGTGTENLGSSLAVGDFTGDGVADYAMGAPEAPGAGTSRGRVLVVNGATGVTFSTLQGLSDSDDFGESLAAIPAVSSNALGTSSLAIGADQGAILPGYVKVYSYKLAGVPPLFINLMSAEFTINGSVNGQDMGEAVASAGDVDGDGIGDIAIGSPGHSTSTGKVEIYSSADQRLLAMFEGSGTASNFGQMIDAIGDTNADGCPNVLIGAPNDDTGTCINMGAAYVRNAVAPPSRTKLMITEVCNNPNPSVELTNFGGTSVDLSDYTVIVRSANTSWSAPLGATTLASKGVAVVSRIGAADFPETPPVSPKLKVLPAGVSLSNGFSAVVALVNRSGIVVDEVRIGNDLGTFSQGSLGGLFRGLAPRSATTVSVERIWGLDSNSGGDWTRQVQTSMGLENRSSGARGTDPIATQDFVINEVDDSPDYIEFHVRSGGFFGIIDGTNYELEIVNIINTTRQTIRPWKGTAAALYGHPVIGTSVSAPAEMPAPASATLPNYWNIAAAGETIGLTADEQAITLYDNYGRVLDVVRTNWRLSSTNYFVNNHPRSPAHWAEWGGAVNRQIGGEGSYGRDASATDTNTGGDWSNQIARSMGSDNGAEFGSALITDLFDVRANNGQGGGIAMILNAGSSMAGKKWSILISAQAPDFGRGPLMGLGWDALNNWVALYNDPFLSGVLDADGSGRFDYPSGLVPAGLVFDTMFILQNAGDPGSLLMQTPVLQLNT